MDVNKDWSFWDNSHKKKFEGGQEWGQVGGRVGGGLGWM